MRLDKALFERGLTQSRSRASMLISDGDVIVNGKTVTKCAFDVSDSDEISVNDSIGYVGRGGLKLEHALKAFGIDCTGYDALDIGASTGGFTQCLLKNGAKSVLAVDVGHGQMDEKLANDPRVTLLEDTNARILTPEMTGGKKDIAVMDVSFISQTMIFPAMFSCLKDSAVAVTLVKPQFEAGSMFLNKNGIIKDKRVYLRVLENIAEAAHEYSFCVSDLTLSPIKGGDGNTEFLIKLEHGNSNTGTAFSKGIYEKYRYLCQQK